MYPISLICLIFNGSLLTSADSYYSIINKDIISKYIREIKLIKLDIKYSYFKKENLN